MPPLRVVLDANVVISGLMRPDSPPGRILRAAVEQTALRALVAPPLIEELRAALRYPRLRPYLRMTPQDADEFVLLLEQVADPVNLQDHPPPGICRDPGDEPYLQTALAGRAECIVTGDADLLTLGEVEGIAILAPSEFERMLVKRP